MSNSPVSAVSENAAPRRYSQRGGPGGSAALIKAATAHRPSMANADTAAHFRPCFMSIAVTTPTAARADAISAAMVLGAQGAPGSRAARAAHPMAAINTAWIHSNARVNRMTDRTVRVAAIARAYGAGKPPNTQK